MPFPTKTDMEYWLSHNIPPMFDDVRQRTTLSIHGVINSHCGGSRMSDSGMQMHNLLSLTDCPGGVYTPKIGEIVSQLYGQEFPTLSSWLNYLAIFDRRRDKAAMRLLRRLHKAQARKATQ